MRRELLDGELPRSVTEARVVIGDWVELYTNVCPHRGLRMRTPARFIGEQRALLTTKRAASPVGTPPRYDRKPVSVVTFTTFRYLVCHVVPISGLPRRRTQRLAKGLGRHGDAICVPVRAAGPAGAGRASLVPCLDTYPDRSVGRSGRNRVRPEVENDPDVVSLGSRVG
ncbi:MAG TPA: integrase core domain-containing protein [Acidimicrobiales bacterium]|nr:integrase core domain-containing protein [Acidimicrobiales bacterium]